MPTRIYKGAAIGIKTDYDGTIGDWLGANVAFPHSARSSKFDGATAPWLNDVLTAIADDETRQIIVRACTGGGKTTLLEAATAFIIGEQPGPMLLVGQNDEMISEWAESRLMPVIDNCAPLRTLMPSNRHHKRKTSILFPHMALFLGGANISTLQEKSMRYCWGDEVWRWKRGMIGEMKARHHDRWNRKTILVSQGWDAGHELDDCWQESEQLVWGFECPECGQWQKYDFNSIIYDEAKTEDGFDWEKVGNSTRYRCSGCGVEWPDTSRARREIASRASYRSEGNPHKSGCLAFTFPAYAVWWIPWRDLVAEWLAANSEKHRGNLEPLRQFIMKRKAEPWKEDVTSDIGEMVGSGYLLADHAGGDTWDGELHRFMTVDKQRDHFWCVIRSWKPDASSRLMWAGRVLTWDILQELAGVFKVKPPLVCVDAGFETNQVYEECSKRGWTAVHGSGRKDFPHIVNGKTANRPTSKIEWATASNMQRCRYFHFSAEATKDKLSLLRAGQAQPWEVPDDMPPDYIEQMDSETKRDIVNAKTKQIERRWVKISGSRPNHLFDCESMQVAAAFVMKLFAPHVTAPSSTNSEES